jgi:NhaP-type Na+/H+ or K+/H+ antiporter
MEREVAEIAGIVVLGVFATWVPWRWRLPSVVLLLALGILLGPIAGFLHPDALFGKALLPFVSLSVAVILFQGGLSLKISELRGGVAPCCGS